MYLGKWGIEEGFFGGFFGGFIFLDYYYEIFGNECEWGNNEGIGLCWLDFWKWLEEF